jgi:hypothetical protein
MTGKNHVFSLKHKHNQAANMVFGIDGFGIDDFGIDFLSSKLDWHLE